MYLFFERLAASLLGPDAPAHSRRLAQRLLAVAAMVGMITLLGPIFGYGPMACAGVLVLFLASPDKTGA